jgi:hypothetical protein
MQGFGAALICGNKFQKGWLDDMALNLVAGSVAQHIHAYFVADSAFPLGSHALTCFADPNRVFTSMLLPADPRHTAYDQCLSS